ncbi:substrate-binding domain-containing protein [Streptomyces sp. NBC_01373]|uniref:substrate-binding domain-containing protein n=1 Tax=Streptomyces sp. NBC_01373 TaxID=2903843 RepID=UPI002255C9F1|nr:substrate-binding domain-containing protein [Streptomyces sp. NBC_01373]MCX4699299.1 substrate-binding and VWA domain-containing protein [Streptomyces sp. NBC_01373]
MTRFDPRGRVNRALLVGVSEYDLTKPPHGVPGDLPAVKHNLNRLRDALLRGRVFGAHEIAVARSPSLDDFDHALRRTAGEAEGLLLLYFTGHGAIPSAGDELFLQMRNASVVAGGHAVFPGAEMFTTALTVLAAGPAERIVVVLDCCFAGNAAWIWETFRDKRRVLLLMSVQANHRTDAGDGAVPTPFTGELVQLLEEDEELTFQELADRLRDRMAAAGHKTVRGEPWEPQSRTEPGEDVVLSARSAPPLRWAMGGAGPWPSGAHEDPEQQPGGHGEEKKKRADLLRTAAAALLAPFRAGATAVTRACRRLGSVVRPAPLALAVVLALAAVGLGSYGIVTLTGGPASCGPPLELRVLTDPDLEPTVSAAAEAYLTSDENTTGDGCRRSGITVYSAGSADGVTALAGQSDAWQEPRDEDTNPQRDVGPQPDVWIPATPAEAARVTAAQDTDAVARLDPDEEPLVYSPVVLAVPKNLAAGNQDDLAGPSLTRMITALRERDTEAEVRRPDPEFTAAALLATIGLHGTGADPVGAEQRVAQPGPPAPTATDLLCTLPDDDAVDNRTAALVPEFLLRSGVGCDLATRTPRVAHYPGDVPGLEPTFVRVRWQDADRDEAARDAAAENFRAWLTGADGQAAFARDGFRSASGAHPLLDADRPVPAGMLSAPAPLEETAGRDEMETALTDYRAAHGPGRVLFLLDSSGSMASLWEGPSGGPGLLEQSLGGLGDQDEYGVWAVSGASGDERPYEAVLPFGRHTRKDAERAVDAARVRDAEADPHAALLAALDDLAARGPDERPRLVVHITDGEDDDRLTGANLDDVLTRAGAAGVPVTMVSLEAGGCDPDRPATRISTASGGRCLDAGENLGAALTDEVARAGTGED